MSDVQALLVRCRVLGAEFALTPDGKLKVRAPAPLPEELQEELRRHKTELLAVLTQQSAEAPRPYINARGELIIPFDSDLRYHWWARGQSIRATLLEINAPPDVQARYVEPDTLTIQ